MNRSVDITPAARILRKAVEYLDQVAGGIESTADLYVAVAAPASRQTRSGKCSRYDHLAHHEARQIESRIVDRISPHDLRPQIHGRVRRRIGQVRSEEHTS